jgi:hypothetical protein
MTMKERFGILTVISLVCLGAIMFSTVAPAIADNTTPPALPYTKTWGNSAGRTGCNATAWGKSDTTMGCSGINSNSKCILLPCKYCLR